MNGQPSASILTRVQATGACPLDHREVGSEQKADQGTLQREGMMLYACAARQIAEALSYTAMLSNSEVDG